MRVIYEEVPFLSIIVATINRMPLQLSVGTHFKF
jgi:hypothetical protein